MRLTGFELFCLTVSVVLFVIYIVAVLRYILNKQTFPAFQLFNGLLVISLVLYCAPWTIFAYLFQSIRVFLFKRIAFSIFLCVLYCYLFFELFSFQKQAKQKRPRSWYLCFVFFFFTLLCQVLSVLLEYFTSHQHTLIMASTPLAISATYFTTASTLLQLISYGWSLFVIFSLFTSVSIPVVQKQLMYFSTVSTVVILFFIALLFFTISSNQPTVLSVTRDAVLIDYVVFMLMGFLPSTSEVKDEYNLFYVEKDLPDTEPQLYNQIELAQDGAQM